MIRLKGDEMMIYTIDVGFVYTDYRLKKDETFKKFNGEHFKEVEEDDLTFSNLFDAKSVAKEISSIDLDGKNIDVRTNRLGNMHLSIRPHRIGKPLNRIFTKDDVMEVLIKGNDNINNALIIDFDGRVRLIPFRDVSSTPHAVRLESFNAGNGYVGPKSKLNHLNNTYLALLNGWSSHLYCHDTMYQDYVANDDEEELLKEIRELIEKL